MIKRLDNIKLNITESEDKLLKIAEKNLGCKAGFFKIIKKSLDARDKNNLFWLYSVAFSREAETPKMPLEKLKNPPAVAVVGSGPAGLFCALRLIERGFAPIIIERGEKVENRRETINEFFEKGRLKVNSNVQFGEGGAGTFSDGKLNTQTRDGLNKEVLETFFKFGAPEEILYLNKPHIGSDKLFCTLQNMRKFVEENGGKYLFNTLFCGFERKNGAISSIFLKDCVTGIINALKVDCVVLAPGHSSRDTFIMLAENGVQMQARNFAVGVRIEHLSKNINFAQYGEKYALLPAADYKFVSHAHERTAFTFCMCPGGVVIPSSSEEGGVVTNGMSNYARDGANSNSAVMVQLNPSDYGEGLFDGMNFQKRLERKAFEYGGGGYKAPVQLFGDFLKGVNSCGFGEVFATYSAGTAFAPLNELLPAPVTQALRAAIPDFGRKLKGFDCPDAVLTGVETRFSSPLRIMRDENCESVSVKGLYPCGEGSGYSGGITSSAADGLKIAEILFKKFY